MIKDEALKLALEKIATVNAMDYEYQAWAREALRENAMREVQRLGQEIEQEPVAIKRMKEWIEYLKRKSDFGQHMKIPSEMSAGTCWELAIELEQFINTAPPQRTWVGLEGEEIRNLWEEATKPDRSTMTMVTSFASLVGILNVL